MYDKQLIYLQKKIKRILADQRNTDRNIYVFGVSDVSRQIIVILKQYGRTPLGIIDNDVTKQGSYCGGIQVLSLKEALCHGPADNIYMFYSTYWREMWEQLTHEGVEKSRIFRLCGKSISFFRKLQSAYIGRNIFKKIKKQYAESLIFLCPYTGTGDIYLIGTFWKEYCQVNLITSYVFFVLSNACKKVAELFNIQNIVVLKRKEDSGYLIDAHMLWPDKVKIKLLNDCWGQIHTNQIEWFRGYKGLEFTQLFKQYVFNLPDRSRPQHPQFKEVECEVSRLMREHGLIYGNTVVLSPYSNTLADLPDVFWVELARSLIQKGYCVCTNSAGDHEPAVKGTITLDFSLSIAPQVIEAAGFFVGIRSGFCDVVSGANAKKIILYDKYNRFYMGSAFEYFNFKTMQLCDDAIEIEFDRDWKQCITKILKNL